MNIDWSSQSTFILLLSLQCQLYRFSVFCLLYILCNTDNVFQNAFQRQLNLIYYLLLYLFRLVQFFKLYFLSCVYFALVPTETDCAYDNDYLGPYLLRHCFYFILSVPLIVNAVLVFLFFMYFKVIFVAYSKAGFCLQ